ncbi:Uncharacterised protein [Clostridium putrefaciens]|uniref:Uncharacterized protein n=1 Tax=Clostridium putrefaciens TaxID=99675 RepID=A0A381J631_9CLOT|nr:Uncharacterised protein [Clostridium putrefaciens]
MKIELVLVNNKSGNIIDDCPIGHKRYYVKKNI